MGRELQCKESKIAELTSVVHLKERVITDMENYKVSHSSLINHCAENITLFSEMIGT